MLLCLVLAVNAVPALRASALYLITDGEATTAVELAEPVTADKLIVVGAADGSAELRFESGHKVTVTHGTDAVQYATTRTNETADALLKRMGISVGPMEMVKVDVSEPEIFIEIAASFTYYETLTEPAEHATVYTESYKVPKGETQVWQQGMDGTREVVYEVVYADGELVSRQAVAEQNNTSVTEYAYVGTLVKEAQAGDTIASVEKTATAAAIFSCSPATRCTSPARWRSSAPPIPPATTAWAPSPRPAPRSHTAAWRWTKASSRWERPCSSPPDPTPTAWRTRRIPACGGAKIDLFMDTYNECIQFGRRNSVAYFLD